MQETIVLYAAPGMGHIIAMVELGKLILHHYSHRFSITILLTKGFLDTPAVSTYIQHVSQSNPSICFHQFPFLSLQNFQSLSIAATGGEFIRQNLPNARDSLRQISETSTVRAFVIDLFCTSALCLGEEFRIPTFYFFTSGAAALAAFLYLPKIHEQTDKSFKDLADTVFRFPGLPPLRATHMPEPILDRDDPAYWDFLENSINLPKANGIVTNTFDGLEPISMKAIADGLCVPDGPTPPVYYVGPLIASPDGRSGGEEEENLDYMSWLDEQPSRSVVFLCFGSRGSFSELQLKDIAKGLEKSGQRFLWVVKKPTMDEKSKQNRESYGDFDLGNVLPGGFAVRNRGRGMVVKSWVPQAEILKKESVGGFVTHCGWNSVLESVVAGVPMVAWPLYAEQHLNRNVLVEDIAVAVAVEQREGDGFVSGDELEKRVRELMESEKGRELRERSKKMKEMALGALGEFGSSTLALKRFIAAIE
ncbi:UDP-glycosyltransferase 88F4 [Ziziphus jujuba]|uniref:Glycosyltransferase n=1 Tax=Ziziphus jujuba TaxID=326968 RepID=A0ABM3IP17_ZIZJJ|nr:UDP-glycosyltransferase 88F4 [Ziziphus jujuba]